MLMFLFGFATCAALIALALWAAVTDNSQPKDDPVRREFYRRLYEGVARQSAS